MISHCVRAAIVATTCAITAAFAPSASLAASFDGPWSVQVFTRSGPCDQSYRYGLLIRGGSVSYLGGAGVAVSGRVTPSGQVSVSVSAMGQSAYGSGRLKNGRGSGTWRGQSSTGACSGVWSASQG